MKRIRELVADMESGSRVALARLISKIENRDLDIPTLIKEIFPKTGRAQIWGITGPPGAGKSTMIECLVGRLRKQGKRVAVIAVDPSSPFSGGALLGDRIRMQKHSQDEGVYIRSLGTRGQHGGLSHSTKEVVLLLDAAGFDVILVETAGVGQTELGILRLAQTVIVILVPESGDSIQVMKAGLMEIADVFAVNKSDRPRADHLVRELVNMIDLAGSLKGADWDVPVHKTHALSDVGTDLIEKSVQEHQDFLKKENLLQSRVQDFLKEEVLDILAENLRRDADQFFQNKNGVKLLEKLSQRKIDPYAVADAFRKEVS